MSMLHISVLFTRMATEVKIQTDREENTFVLIFPEIVNFIYNDDLKKEASQASEMLCRDFIEVISRFMHLKSIDTKDRH